MKLKVNLNAKDEELTAICTVEISGQKKCSARGCRKDAVGYDVTVESIDNKGAAETKAGVLREAKRILKKKLGTKMALCLSHFADYLKGIADDSDGVFVEIVET